MDEKRLPLNEWAPATATAKSKGPAASENRSCHDSPTKLKATTSVSARGVGRQTCSLRNIASSQRADWPIERKTEYFDWAKKLSTSCRVRLPDGVVSRGIRETDGSTLFAWSKA